MSYLAKPTISKERSDSGFTLIELLLVIVLVGIMVGFGAVSMDNLSFTARLKASARELASVVRLGQDQAVVTGIYHTLEFDFFRSRYRLLILPEWATTDEDVDDEDIEFLGWHEFRDRVFIEDITEDDGDVIEELEEGETYRVGFDIDGPRYGYVVHIIDDKGERYSLEVNGLTGLISFYDYYREIDQLTEEDFDFK